MEVIRYGDVPDYVVEMAMNGVQAGLRAMCFDGVPPSLHISEGAILRDDGVEMHACYTHGDSAIRIWWKGVAGQINGVSDDIKLDVALFFFGCHEAVHHVQWQRGYGEPTVDDGTDSYINHPLEVEANRIAHEATGVFLQPAEK